MGFELNRIMQQYGVATPGKVNYSGSSAPVDPRPALAPGTSRTLEYTEADAKYSDLLAKYNADRAAYDAYSKEYQTRMMNTPMYLQSQFKTGNEPTSIGLQWARDNTGVKTYDTNIKNYFASNPDANVSDINKFAEKYGVSAQDIFDATQNRYGNTLKAPINTVTTLVGGAGNDTVVAGGGADTVVAGGGVDTVVAGSGNDTLNTLTLLDTLLGGTGNDTIDGGTVTNVDNTDTTFTTSVPASGLGDVITLGDDGTPNVVATSVPAVADAVVTQLDSSGNNITGTNYTDYTGYTGDTGEDLKSDVSYIDATNTSDINESGGTSFNADGTIEYPDNYDLMGDLNVANSFNNTEGFYNNSDFKPYSYNFDDIRNSYDFGGSCPAPWIDISLADGSTVKAGDIKVGMLVHTQHESSGEWGDYPVTAVSFAKDTRWVVLLDDGREFVGTFNHRVKVGDDWVEIQHLKAGDKLTQLTGEGIVKESKLYDHDGDVVKITVDGAHTYISQGFLSHNIKTIGNSGGDSYIDGTFGTDFYGGNVDAQVAKGGSIKTHYQTAGRVSLPSGYGSDEEEAAFAEQFFQPSQVAVSPVAEIPPAQVMQQMPMDVGQGSALAEIAAAQRTPVRSMVNPAAPMPVQAAPAVGGDRMANIQAMLAAYGPKDSAYAADLTAARASAKSESDAFTKMLTSAMSSPEDAQSSKAEMYFRLASAFGAPTKTGHFAESLGAVGKELGEFAKNKRASAREKQLLGLEVQKLKMASTKEDLNTLRTLAGKEMDDKRAIASKLIDDYIKSGEPQSTAGKQALDEGFKTGTPAYQKRVAEIGNANIEGKFAQITASLGGLNVAQSKLALDEEKLKNQQKQQAKLSPTEIRMKSDTEESIAANKQSLADIKQAYALNPNSLAGGWRDRTQQFLSEAAGSEDPTIVNTRILNNLLGSQGLAKLKSTFGGAPTEGERAILMELEGINAKSKAERGAIIKRTYKVLQDRLAREQSRLNQINSGDYRTATPIEGGTE